MFAQLIRSTNDIFRQSHTCKLCSVPLSLCVQKVVQAPKQPVYSKVNAAKSKPKGRLHVLIGDVRTLQVWRLMILRQNVRGKPELRRKPHVCSCAIPRLGTVMTNKEAEGFQNVLSLLSSCLDVLALLGIY